MSLLTRSLTLFDLTGLNPDCHRTTDVTPLLRILFQAVRKLHLISESRESFLPLRQLLQNHPRTAKTIQTSEHPPTPIFVVQFAPPVPEGAQR